MKQGKETKQGKANGAESNQKPEHTPVNGNNSTINDTSVNTSEPSYPEPWESD